MAAKDPNKRVSRTRKDKSDDLRVVHHIVYSVKGGCGKTSFSLFLALCEPYYKFDGSTSDFMLNPYDEYGNRMYSGVANFMLDVDFLGTSLMYALKPPSGSLVTIPGMIFDGQKVRDIRTDVSGGGSGHSSDAVTNVLSDDGEKYVLYSENRERDKAKFHVKRENTPLLKYDEFGYEMKHIQSEIMSFACLRERNGNLRRLNIIYDMPPNTDGYTDALFREIYDVTRGGGPGKDSAGQRVVLYLLYGNAMTLRCDVDWLREFVSGGHAPDMTVVFVYDLSDSGWDHGEEPSKVMPDALKNLAPDRTENGAGVDERSANAEAKIGLVYEEPESVEDREVEEGEKNAGKADAGTNETRGGKYLGSKYVRKLLGKDITDSLSAYYLEFPYCGQIRMLNDDDDSGKPVRVSKAFLKEMRDDILAKLGGNGFVRL